MIITQWPLWNLSAGAQENKIVCQLKNEMKMVRIKTDMELVTLMMKELIEMIESLQFRCYFKF